MSSLWKRLFDASLVGVGFHRLWLGETASRIGTQITFLAIPLTAVTVLHAGAFAMGVLTAAGSLATLLFGLPAGVWADRLDRRRLMLAANFGQVLVLVAIPVLYWLDALGMAVLCAAALVSGALSLAFDSALAAYLPALLRREHLMAANARMEGSTAVAEVSGPGVAGVLFQVVGAPIAFLVDAATYLVSCSTLLTMPPAPPERLEGSQASVLQEARDGVKYLMNDQIQRPLAFAAAHFNLFASMFFAVYVLWLLHDLGFSAAGVGLVGAVTGAAGLLGAAVASRVALRAGVGPTLVVAYALPGFAAVATPLAILLPSPADIVLVIFGQAVWTASVVVNIVLSESVKQALVPPAMLGRTTATIRFMTWGIEPFGALASGLLASAVIGIQATMIVACAGLSLSALWLVRSPVPAMHDLTELQAAVVTPSA
jgi:predicted MFS family arabinose efflux permease